MEIDKQPNISAWPMPRQEVENMHAYSAPLEGRRDYLRLDFNENTIGPSPLVAKALKQISAGEIATYPEYSGLREAVVENLTSKGLKVPLQTTQIGLFNGVDAAIHAIFHAYGNQGDQLLTTTPTFGYYGPCAHMQGMQISEIPYKGKHFDFPMSEIKEALIAQKPRLLIICNPNNPTGTRLAPEMILELAVFAPNTLVVIDELYEAFTGDSILPIVDFEKTPNLVVLRSLSKTAGLAGLRIGFAIGDSNVINRINRVTGPYDVNGFAVTAALTALKDQPYIDEYVAKVLLAKQWIEVQLKQSNVRHHLAGGNYLLIWPKRQNTEIERALKENGILVRNMNGKALIDKSLRVSIGTKKQMQEFWEAFQKNESMSTAK